MPSQFLRGNQHKIDEPHYCFFSNVNAVRGEPSKLIYFPNFTPTMGHDLSQIEPHCLGNFYDATQKKKPSWDRGQF